MRMIHFWHFEKKFIKYYNSLYPNGYNLTSGGTTFRASLESRRRVSKGVYNYYKDKKIKRFLKLETNIGSDFNQYIKPLRKHKEQYGWYVYIKGIKADFGGSHITLENSKIMAIDFLKKLKQELAKHLVAGKSLEP